MSSDIELVQFSLSAVVAILSAIVGAVLTVALWCWRVILNQQKTITALNELTEMHLDEDSGFSTRKTNSLLLSHMAEAKDMHMTMKRVLSSLDESMLELSHYIKRLIEVETGKPEPPFMVKQGG